MQLAGWQRTGDVALASWILPRLTGPPGAVCGSVPDGFTAYARICHPVSDVSGRNLTWAQEAEVTGAVAHPLMQWHALMGASDPYEDSAAGWPGQSPERGNLDENEFNRLTTVLRSQTRTSEDGFCGYSTIYTEASSVTLIFGGTGQGGSSAWQTVLPAEKPTGIVNLVHHGARDYELFTGPLASRFHGGRGLGSEVGLRAGAG